MSKENNKWTGPDEINGVLHVGKGYRQAFAADRHRIIREQWYPGDSESGEDGIWGDARPGVFDPSKVYRVPVERKDEPGVHGDSEPPVKVVKESATASECRDRFCWMVDWLHECCETARKAMEDDAAPPVERSRCAGIAQMAESAMRWIGQNASTLKDNARPVSEFEEGGEPDGPDMVNHPDHYNQGDIECIDAIRAALTPQEFRGFCKGCAIKYVWREQGKGGDEDLSKGVRHLEWAVKDRGNTKGGAK